MEYLCEDIYVLIINLSESEDIETCFLVSKLFNKICMTKISPLKLERYDIGDKKYYKYFTNDNKIKGKILCNFYQIPLAVLERIAKKINIKGMVTYSYSIMSFKGKINSYKGSIELLKKPIKIPVRDKDKNPIMIMKNGIPKQKNIVYSFGTHNIQKVEI